MITLPGGISVGIGHDIADEASRITVRIPLQDKAMMAKILKALQKVAEETQDESRSQDRAS